MKLTRLIKRIIFSVAPGLFLLVFCAIQLPATYESICQYKERKEWPEVMAIVTQVEYLGEAYDSETGYYAEWQLYVSYEYEDVIYEDKEYPYIQDTERGEDGEKFMREIKKIALNPEDPSEVVVKRDKRDVVASIIVCFALIVGFVVAICFGVINVKKVMNSFRQDNIMA